MEVEIMGKKARAGVSESLIGAKFISKQCGYSSAKDMVHVGLKYKNMQFVKNSGMKALETGETDPVGTIGRGVFWGLFHKKVTPKLRKLGKVDVLGLEVSL